MLEYVPLILLALIVATVFTAIALRRVVAPNEVHIVQSSGQTKSYGKDTPNGNSYYEWPSWVPLLGVVKTVLPVSVFDIPLLAYEAYDKDRVPFVVDIISFFRINDTNLTAQRVQDFPELESQLTAIVQGAIRTVLASHDIDSIMTERSKFGVQFTDEVKEQLKNWGIVPVKNIELMDIRDSKDSMVVHNIMQKKKSYIEMQSRIEVAKNMQDAQIAETNAKQNTLLQQQIADEAIGLRTAQKTKLVGIAEQQSSQEITDQQKITKDKEMSVIRVIDVQRAEIDRDVNVVKADQLKQTTILGAEGTLESKKREAQGIQIAGEAKAAAETALNLAPVQAQITLAKEIGENDAYQKYLISLRQIEANETVGIEQAGALKTADIKIIANSGDPVTGISSVRDLLSSKGGTAIGAMLEGLSNTDEGKAIVTKFTGTK